MFNIINKLCPESLHDKFAERSKIRKYGTRSKTDVQIPRPHLDLSRKVLTTLDLNPGILSQHT